MSMIWSWFAPREVGPYERRVKAIYMRAGKIGMMDGDAAFQLVQKFQGREEDLIAQLVAKYGPEPVDDLDT